MHLLCALIAASLLPAAGPDPSSGGEITVRVSRDFANPPLVEKTMSWSPSSAMELLARAAAVETAFGGAFVERIDGIPEKRTSRAGRAWLYYVNGMIAQTGAKACATSAGDVIWWDFHPWEGVVQAQALIGSYPQPFLRAAGEPSRPVCIVHSPASETKAGELKASLARRGLANVRAQPLSCLETPDGSAVLVLGAWEEIARFPAVRTAIAHGDRCGLFIGGDRSAMRVLDLKRTPRASYPGAGAIAAVAGGGSRPAPLWLVTGTDAAAAGRAADILISHPEKIRGMAAAVIDGDSVRPAPAIE